MSGNLRAVLYLRVSTAKQAEQDVSIPDQQRQGEAYCLAKGYELVETFVEPGASATTDRRPVFQRMSVEGKRQAHAWGSVGGIAFPLSTEFRNQKAGRSPRCISHRCKPS
jgi:hypothetical protein